VHPTEGELNPTAVGKRWVGGVAIDRQDAFESGLREILSSFDKCFSIYQMTRSADLARVSIRFTYSD
jgi:hypothetical protein